MCDGHAISCTAHYSHACSAVIRAVPLYSGVVVPPSDFCRKLQAQDSLRDGAPSWRLSVKQRVLARKETKERASSDNLKAQSLNILKEQRMGR